MPGTCITNTARKSWFGVTVMGAFGEDMNDEVNALSITSIFSQISNGLTWTPTYSRDEGINGTPFFDKAGVALDSEMGTGSVVLEPRFGDLGIILPMLLGNTGASGVYEPTVDGYCQYFKCAKGLGITTQNFGSCKTSQFSFSSSKGQPKLRLDWGIEACLQETTGAGTLPALSYSDTAPLIHTASTMTIDSVVTPIDNLTITGTNNLSTDTFYNNVTRLSLPSNRQEYTMSCTTPFDKASDVALMAKRASTISAQLIYSAGTNISLTIDFPNLIVTAPTPGIPSGDAAIRHEGLQFAAYADIAADPQVMPIKFTVDDDAGS